jgi:hypothetical protein
MPQIINPFRVQNTPLAQAITQVGSDIYGDQLTPALKREQLIAAQRGNVETGNLAQSFADPAGKLDFQAGILSGYKPQDMADMRRLQMADTYGARDPRTQASQIGAGGSAASTFEAVDMADATDRRGQDIASSDRRFGFNLNDATERYKFANTPEEVMVNGQAGFLPREKVFDAGVQPILSQSELGPAAEFNQWYDFYLSRGMPKEKAEPLARQQIEKSQNARRTTVGADGGVTIEEGELGALTNSNTTAAQRERMSAAKFNAAADRAIALTEKDPTLFGPVGKARSLAQGAMGILDNIALMTGKESVDALKSEIAGAVTTEGTPMGMLIPELYDPSVSEVESLWGYLVYATAAAVAGQENRSTSDSDVEKARDMVGRPHGLDGAQALKTKLITLKNIVNANQRIADQALRGEPLGTEMAPSGAPAPTPGSVPATPPPPGVDAKTWGAMTPEERALWSN